MILKESWCELHGLREKLVPAPGPISQQNTDHGKI